MKPTVLRRPDNKLRLVGDWLELQVSWDSPPLQPVCLILLHWNIKTSGYGREQEALLRLQTLNSSFFGCRILCCHFLHVCGDKVLWNDSETHFLRMFKWAPLFPFLLPFPLTFSDRSSAPFFFSVARKSTKSQDSKVPIAWNECTYTLSSIFENFIAPSTKYVLESVNFCVPTTWRRHLGRPRIVECATLTVHLKLPHSILHINNFWRYDKPVWF